MREADEQLAEFKNMQKKMKKMDLHNKELELQVNKLKTEIVNLRDLNKQWKESGKFIYLNLNKFKNLFDSQVQLVAHGKR